MFKKNCPSCNKESEKKFDFCPYCGFSFRAEDEEENFGLLGKDDTLKEMERMERGIFGGDMALPKEFQGIVNSLMKQLNQQLSNLNKEDSDGDSPRGFKIQISSGMPKNAPMIREVSEEVAKYHHKIKRLEGIKEVSVEESERRKLLPRIEPESNITRLSDKLVYKIKIPGVKSEKDIIITKLENSIEIKAYSKDKCYYKIVPLKVEIMSYKISKEILFLELKG